MQRLAALAIFFAIMIGVWLTARGIVGTWGADAGFLVGLAIIGAAAVIDRIGPSWMQVKDR